jgi:hypothetical protein
MFGHIPGSRHDNYILERSGLVEFLREHFPQDIVFGDAAYPKYPFLLSPFDNINLTLNEIALIKRMSSVRESVEWGFKDILDDPSSADDDDKEPKAKEPKVERTIIHVIPRMSEYASPNCIEELTACHITDPLSQEQIDQMVELKNGSIKLVWF